MGLTKKDLPSAEILLQPHIPKPLHGLNPRTLLGVEWWDPVRREAYKFFDYKCWACGKHKAEAHYHNWLEGHENYLINYETGRVELLQVMALCHCCHNFIHSGRMAMMVVNNEMEWDKFIFILRRGFSVLKENDLPPNWYALHSYKVASGCVDEKLPVWHSTAIEISETMILPDFDEIPWDSWHLIIDGERYNSLYKSYDAWKEFYSQGKE